MPSEMKVNAMCIMVRFACASMLYAHMAFQCMHMNVCMGVCTYTYMHSCVLRGTNTLHSFP